MRALHAAILLSAFVVVLAHAAKPQIQWNESYDFEALQTFQWQYTPDSSLEERNPFMHSRIIATIEYELTGSGLTEVDSNPDVYVTYHASANSRVRLETDHWDYGFGGYGRGWRHYGYGRAGPAYATTRVTEYDEGTLIVDIWDAENQELVWRGSVTQVFSDNVQRAERQVVKAIERMADRGRRLWEKANR